MKKGGLCRDNENADTDEYYTMTTMRVEIIQKQDRGLQNIIMNIMEVIGFVFTYEQLNLGNSY